MTTMRAKVRVTGVTKGETVEQVRFSAVARNGSYPTDGSDEDNTYAKFSPQAEFAITIANPALLGQFENGQAFYVDFTPVPPQGAAAGADNRKGLDPRAMAHAALSARVDDLEQKIEALGSPVLAEVLCADGVNAGHVVVLPSDLKPGDHISVSLTKTEAKDGAL